MGTNHVDALYVGRFSEINWGELASVWEQYPPAMQDEWLCEETRAMDAEARHVVLWLKNRLPAMWAPLLWVLLPALFVFSLYCLL